MADGEVTEDPVIVAGPLSVQLHIHGHSNHNVGQGSMQYQSHHASYSGFDLLWWSDHLTTLNGFKTVVVDFKAAQEDGANRLVWLDAPPLIDDLFLNLVREISSDVGGPTLLHIANGIRMEGAGAVFLLGDVGSRRWVGHQAFTRSVLTDPLVRFLGAPCPGQDGDLVLHFELSVHVQPDMEGVGYTPYRDPHNLAETYSPILEMKFSPTAMEEVTTDGLLLASKVMRVNGPFDITIPLRDLADNLRDGSDNAIQRVWFSLAGSSPCFEIEELSFAHGGLSTPRIVMAEMESFALDYAQRFGIQGLVGFEDDTEVEHLNIFLPSLDGMEPTYALLGSLVGQGMLDAVHAQGGIVSINHIFGAGGADMPILPSSERATRLLELIERELGGPSWDLLEVGYPRRGGYTLEDYLLLWDTLWANGEERCGGGVSDHHGGGWGLNLLGGNNSWTTWIWTPSGGSSRSDLIGALASCQAAFGDPFLLEGRVVLDVNGIRMGGIFQSTDETALIKALHAGLPAGVKIEAVGIALDGSKPARRLFRERVPKGGLVIAVSEPQIVRLELSYRDGIRLVTNPVKILPPS